MKPLADVLDQMTIPARLVEPMEEQGMVRCLACGHRCKIRPGRRGICQVRFNQEGVLRVPWGYVAALNVDPIEKKPFNHVYPGTRILTFGMMGCDFHCGFCQNWVTSQTLRDPNAGGEEFIKPVSPAQLVEIAYRTGCDAIASSYNEPLITTEWAVDVFEVARAGGLKCCVISNGNATPEALGMLKPYLSAYKVDLKTMNDKHYRELGGVLQNVLDTIQMAHDMGLWVEVVTLVIPGFNDSPEELWSAARFLAAVSPEIPWHVTAFHPDYKMTDPPPTSASILKTAAEIGQEAGLQYVYAGNLPGRVGSYEDTHCPNCQALLVQRRGYTILKNRVAASGKCPECGTIIPGVWN
jgi:pyruvate formate lyase activating enzyme